MIMADFRSIHDLYIIARGLVPLVVTEVDDRIAGGGLADPLPVPVDLNIALRSMA